MRTHVSPASWAAMAAIVLLGSMPSRSAGQQTPTRRRLIVGMTLVSHAGSLGAVFLDGSRPGYHFHPWHGLGARSWLLQFEGGGCCNDVASCLERSRTRRGSTRYMNRYEVFSGILSNDSAMNPDFYNWNRVKIRYCDGASFAGDSLYHNDNNTLFQRTKDLECNYS